MFCRNISIYITTKNRFGGIAEHPLIICGKTHIGSLEKKNTATVSDSVPKAQLSTKCTYENYIVESFTYQTASRKSIYPSIYAVPYRTRSLHVQAKVWSTAQRNRHFSLAVQTTSLKTLFRCAARTR